MTLAAEADPGPTNLPSGASADWWALVQKDIAQSVYHVRWGDTARLPERKNAFHAENPAQNLLTYFTDAGPRVVRRDSAKPEWVWGLECTGFCDRDISAVDRVETNGARIEFHRNDGLVEWYVNSASGLEQGFTVTSNPGPGDSLAIELAVRGNLIPNMTPNDGSVEFLSADRVSVIRYSHLTARDAAGKELRATMRLVNGRAPEGAEIRLSIDARGAVYPITIDPLATDSAWSAGGESDYDYYGYSVATAGDVNGDGYSDVIVGAYGYASSAGRVYVYYGSASGLPVTPNWVADSGQTSARFGYSVATAGDVNGDGYSDIIVGADSYDNGQTNEGAVFVWFGSATGLGGNGTPANADWTAEGGQASAHFGVSVATAGDINGDGYSDIIVGADDYDNGQTNEGAAFVWFGSASGLGDTGTPANADWIAEGDQSNASLGVSVATAGDVNGDGYSDIIVGASNYDSGLTNEGAAFVWYGSASGLGDNGTPANSDWSATGYEANAYFGSAVATAGDVNGDGYADVIVGARGSDTPATDAGRAFVWLGSSTGLGPNGAPANADWSAESDSNYSWLGYSVASAGDVNGDGYGDVIVGAYHRNAGASAAAGAAFVWFGSASGLGPNGVPANADWAKEGDQAYGMLGASVATAGDVNGDGYADVIAGADGYNSSAGRAYVYCGAVSSLSAGAKWSVESDQTSSYLGSSVASAGDVNGDGYADVIVGAYGYALYEGRVFVYYGSATGLSVVPDWTADGGQSAARLGRSVSTAGDVNGDGYSDIIVGANYYDNGQTNEGAVFVWYGSASGLGENGTPANADWMAEGDQASAFLGYSVSTAGDVNGDGYSDIIVGAYFYDNGQTNEGAVFVWYGSATGLGENGTPANADWMAEGDQNNANFGVSVATAGDVNGDGYSDIIVGANYYDSGLYNEGAAFVWLGSASGLGANGTPANADWSAASYESSANFGLSVASAGDVNGDGFADIIVGAPLHDSNGTDSGSAFVWYGSALGLGPNGTPANADWSATSDSNYSWLGYSVSTAGDVNGDGYADLIVGAYHRNAPSLAGAGAVFVWFGSAAGLGVNGAPGNADWAAVGDQAYGTLGASVATAGDVNGDGYADVIAGADAYNSARGRAYAYCGAGEAGSGLSLLPRQRRSDDAGPIAHLGVSESETSVRLAALGRTPFGRGKTKLECEVKQIGTPFDGSGTIRSADWTDTGVTGGQLNELIGDLTKGAVYHWRVRLLYSPASTPFQQKSRWITVPWNGGAEPDFRIIADTIPPTVTLNCSAPDPINGDIVIEAALSEVSATFVSSDITPSNATVLGFSGSELNYTFTLHPLAPGLFSCVVNAGAFTDPAGNPNAVASNIITRTFDNTPPTALLESSASNPTAGNIVVTATLTEASTDFTQDDIMPVNATVSGFSGSGASYTFTLHPLSPGLFSCVVDADTFHDTAGNANAGASNSIERSYDNAPPAALLECTAPDPAASDVVVTVTLSEVSGDFTEGDVSPTNAAVKSFSGDGMSYSFTLHPLAPGAFSCVVAGGAFHDAAGNGNTVSNTLARNYDPTRPSLTLSTSAADPINAAITVTATLSETSVNFTAGDVTPTNATVGGFAGTGVSYSWTLTPTAQGAFSCIVAAGAFADAAGNTNTVSNTLTRTYDSIPPSAPVVTGVTPTTNPKPTWTWHSGGGGNGMYRHKLDNNDLSGGATQTSNTTFAPSSNLAPGTHTLYVQERDAANNWSPTGSFSISVNAASYEGDVAPRSGGDGSVNTTDVLQEADFVLGIDTPTAGNEFQRSDCAPKTSRGDGTVEASDWVQTGRYAAGLDPVQSAGGPQSSAKGATSVIEATSRDVLIVDTVILGNQTGVVEVRTLAQGDENALAFSVNYDPSKLTFVSVSAGPDVPLGATFLSNEAQVAQGKLGLLVGLSPGTSFAAGLRSLAEITFHAADVSSTVTTEVEFGDQPAKRSISNAAAQDLSATFTSGGVTVELDPTIRRVSVADTVIPSNQAGIAPLRLQSQGNENAVALSLTFDPAELTLVSIAAGSDVLPGATFQSNVTQVTQGKLGLEIGLSPGTTFAPGLRSLAEVTFQTVNAPSTVNTDVGFGDLPEARVVRNAAGLALPVTYTPGAVTILRPSADIDGDGVIGAVDIQLVINSALGLGTGFNADVNNDGQVNAVDVQLVINAALGLSR